MEWLRRYLHTDYALPLVRKRAVAAPLLDDIASGSATDAAVREATVAFGTALRAKADAVFIPRATPDRPDAPCST